MSLGTLLQGTAIALFSKRVAIFITHQLIGTVGIVTVPYLAGFSTVELIDRIGGRVSVQDLYWVLTGTPFYPAQIAVGLYFGWWLGRRLRNRAMVWVWILPLAIVCYVVIRASPFVPEWTSILIRPGMGQSRWSYYFGWGCRPTAGCLDQLVTTLPLYTSVAYSVAGWLALRTADSRNRSQR